LFETKRGFSSWVPALVEDCSTTIAAIDEIVPAPTLYATDSEDTPRRIHKMTTRWLQVLPDADTAARRAAEVIAGRLQRSVATRGQFCLALSGGSAAIEMFEALAAKSLPWSQVEIYQVDERVAPRASSHRNLTSIDEAFGGTEARIVAMPVDSDDLASAAARYEAMLPASFDLVHLSLGLDGHTASLFAGDAALDEVNRDVACCVPHNGYSRVTLTFKGLSKAAEVLWLVTGAQKAAPLAHLCADDSPIPARRVPCERARIVTDAAAVRMLESNCQSAVHLWHRANLSYL
jgi:6-phosphogluconolactonase